MTITFPISSCPAFATLGERLERIEDAMIASQVVPFGDLSIEGKHLFETVNLRVGPRRFNRFFALRN